MKKVWMWILIVFGVLIVGFGIAMFAFRGFALNHLAFGGRSVGWMMGFRPNMMGFHPMMMGMGFFMLLRLVFYAGLIGLAVYGLVALFRHPKGATVQSAQVSATTPAEQAVQATQRTCVKCSRPLEEDWQNCPYCGKKQ